MKTKKQVKQCTSAKLASSSRQKGSGLTKHECTTYQRQGMSTKLGYQLGPRDKWEIDSDSLTIENVTLQKGSFGEVRKGTLSSRTESVTVAVKYLLAGGRDEDFRYEAYILEKLSHKNVIKIYGVCNKEERFHIVTEIMDCNLLEHLLDKGCEMQLSDLLGFIGQIIDGMVYISSKKILHLDLAARNVLVKDGDILKIADFGLAVDCNFDTRPNRRSLRAFPPERIEKNDCSEKTDVWSFGLVLFEMVTRGGNPLQGVEDEVDLIRKLKNNSLPFLRNPEGCPQQLFQIMLKCYITDPHERPAFEDLRQMIDAYGKK